MKRNPAYKAKFLIASPDVQGSAEQLSFFLSEPNTDKIKSYVGNEKMEGFSGNIEFWKGEYGAWRILHRSNDGAITGAIQGVSKGKKHVLSNIVVREDQRRKGIAFTMLKFAEKVRKGFVVDGHLTEAGAKLFGYR